MTAVKSTTQALTQAAMKAWVTAWEEHREDDNEDPHLAVNERGYPELRNSSTAMEMLFNYIEERRGILQSPDFKLVAIEQPFAVPLDSSRSDLLYIGRLDKVFDYQGRRYIGEHKTTTSYKKDGPFRSDFMDSFSPNSQVDGYLYAAHLIYGDQVKACWIDASLVHAKEHNGIRFIPVERQLSQLGAWLWEARYWVAQIEANESALKNYIHANDEMSDEYLPAFPKNTSSCNNFGNCSYLDLCKMWSNPSIKDDPPGFVREHWEPFNVLEFNKIKNARVPGTEKKLSIQDVLYDNTRISAFRGCPRYYYFRHQRDLRPEGDKRYFLFGSAWHAAMDLIWKELARG